MRFVSADIFTDNSLVQISQGNWLTSPFSIKFREIFSWSLNSGAIADIFACFISEKVNTSKNSSVILKGKIFFSVVIDAYVTVKSFIFLHFKGWQIYKFITTAV